MQSGCERIALFDGSLIVLWSKVGIPCFHGYGVMALRLLNRSQVHTLHHKTADSRMSQAAPDEAFEARHFLSRPFLHHPNPPLRPTASSVSLAISITAEATPKTAR
jgi:hypothetical protein